MLRPWVCSWPGVDTCRTEMFESTSPMLVPGGRVYEQRRVICDALESIPGISLVRPKATFYCFPKIDAKSFGIINDERFVLDFLREKKVLLVHGRAFHWPDPDHFRIVYLPNVRVPWRGRQTERLSEDVSSRLRLSDPGHAVGPGYCRFDIVQVI